MAHLKNKICFHLSMLKLTMDSITWSSGSNNFSIFAKVIEHDLK